MAKPMGLKESQGASRKAHFAAGGTCAMWRGRAQTLDERRSKARASALACRGRRWAEGL